MILGVPLSDVEQNMLTQKMKVESFAILKLKNGKTPSYYTIKKSLLFRDETNWCQKHILDSVSNVGQTSYGQYVYMMSSFYVISIPNLMRIKSKYFWQMNVVMECFGKQRPAQVGNIWSAQTN